MIELPPLTTLDQIDLKQIAESFKPPPNSNYSLPRIAFIGWFRHIGTTMQRMLCMNIGFEYFGDVEFGATDERGLQAISSNWSTIAIPFTKVVVIGNDYSKTPEWEIEAPLSKHFRNDPRPMIEQYKIPVIMEEELWRLHLDYPYINNNTRWDDSEAIILSMDLLPEPQPLKKINDDGLDFGYNCKYLMPQGGKCEVFARDKMNQKMISDGRWLDINKAIEYSKLLDFDLVEKISKKELSIKISKTKKSAKVFITAAYDYDYCPLFEYGGSCINFEPHKGDKIKYLMQIESYENHPNYGRYKISKEERTGILHGIIELEEEGLFR